MPAVARGVLCRGEGGWPVRLSLKSPLSLRSPGLAGGWRGWGSASQTQARVLCPSEGPQAGPATRAGGPAGFRSGGIRLHRSLPAAPTCPGQQPRALSDGPRAQAFCCSAGPAWARRPCPRRPWEARLRPAGPPSGAAATAAESAPAFLLKPRGYEQAGLHFPGQEASVLEVTQPPGG